MTAPVVTAVLARVFVDDLEAALPTYAALAGGAPVRRFDFREVTLAWVGPFLLLQVVPELRHRYARIASLVVDDISDAQAVIERHGGQVLEGPDAAPHGQRMIARHGDGALFEYLELTPRGDGGERRPRRD